ncbi:MAG: N-acetyltransferase [Firmicutes bacterium]|nr:N-acetyltransferase [Bacillota bacterium]
MYNFIHPAAILGENCQIGYYTVINAGVVIGDRAVIGNGVTVYPGTVIGHGCIISDNAVLGKPLTLAKISTVKIVGELPPLRIGAECKIGAGAVIYAGTVIGNHCLVGDLASVREQCRLGEYVVVGRGVAVENQVTIGDYTKIQTGAYITAHTTIADHVFIGPMAKTYNDNYMGRTEKRFQYLKGPTIHRGARVGGGALLLPGVVINEEAFVAAGALVTRDVPARRLVKGVPARVVREVPAEELLDYK